VKRNLYLVLVLILALYSSDIERVSLNVIGSHDGMFNPYHNKTFDSVFSRINTETVSFDIDGEFHFPLISTDDTIKNVRNNIPFYYYFVGIKSKSMNIIRNYDTELYKSSVTDSLISYAICDGLAKVLYEYDYLDCSNSNFEVISSRFTNLFQLNDIISVDELSNNNI